MSKQNETLEVYYDDGCVLCQAAATFVNKKTKNKSDLQQSKACSFIALHSPKGKAAQKSYYRAKPPKNDTLLVIPKNSRDEILAESQAVLQIIRTLPIPYRWLYVFNIFPKKWLDMAYRFVARNRHRLKRKKTSL